MKSVGKIVMLSAVAVWATGWQLASAATPSGGELTLRDPSSSATVSVGERFRILLPSNATTGYRWDFAKPLDSAYLKLVKSEYIPPVTKPGIVGAGGEQLWVLEAVSPGQTQISLRYARPWEKGSSWDKSVVFGITIRPAAQSAQNSTTSAAERKRVLKK